MSKAKEREAMEQIRAIVNGLGKDSYIAAAMEGVWEIMEENIECDWACSMGYRLEEKDKQIAGLLSRIKTNEEKLKDADSKMESMLNKTIAQKDEIDNLNGQIRSMTETVNKQTEEIANLHAENGDLVMDKAALNDTIIHLKAKLYDALMA